MYKLISPFPIETINNARKTVDPLWCKGFSDSAIKK